MTRRILFSFFSLVMAFVMAGCGNTKVKPEPGEKRYPLTGEVTRLDDKARVVTIKHDEIPGFMEAMTMGFPVLEPSEWVKLKPEMKLKATVVDRKNDFYLTDIEEVK